ncbi:MAG TPA: hypothetical protein VGY99_24685 [Candidatus Binataceae bacterium]|jgi:hypothetical protein|nr:hypothetical protein [Candidatus Binataceae bacterium]
MKDPGLADDAPAKAESHTYVELQLTAEQVPFTLTEITFGPTKKVRSKVTYGAENG